MPEHMAGTEVYVHTLASQQKMSGWQVSVLIPHFDYYRPGRFRGRYDYDGIDVYEYNEPSNPLNRNVHSGTGQPAGLANFTAFLQTHQPDVIHFHELTRSIGFGAAHVREAKRLGAKVILTMHLSGYTCNTNTLIHNNKLCGGEIREFQCSECSCKTLLKFPAFLSYPTALISGLSGRLGLTQKLPVGRFKTLLSFPAVIRRIKDELQELVANTDQLVCLTDWYKKILILNGVPPDKITVIPQGLPAASPNTSQTAGRPVEAAMPGKQTHSPGSPLKIVFIGRIQPQKGVDLLIEAAKAFNAGQLVVDLYGKEEDSEFFSRCMAALASTDTVHFRGQLSREAVVNTLRGYDMLCLPSTFSEMSSLVIQEAFAAGIPVLASSVYGNIEQIKDGDNGLLFDFKSSADLRSKLQRLIQTPGLLPALKANVRPPGNFLAINSAYRQLYVKKEIELS